MGRTDLEKSEATNRWISKNTNRNSLQFQFLEKGNEHPEWLPDGWNVDFKTRKSGAHMGAGYKCYIDPLNGYKFYSKPEVLRYLETVNGSNCTFKNEKGCTAEYSPSNPSHAAKRQKLKHSASKQQLFAGKEVSDKGILELSDGNRSEKGQNVKVSTEVMVAPVPIDETVVKMPLLEDTVANHAEIKESNPADVHEKNYTVCVTEKGNDENHSAPSISKKKKELNVPHRFSRRLAGIGPDQVANTVTHEQASHIVKGNLRKNRTTVDIDLENKSSQQANVVPKIESLHKMHGELLNKRNSSSEIDLVFRDQPSQLVTEKIVDNKKPEHQYSLSLDSSASSLKVAMKTITGELPAMDDPHAGHGLASEANFLKEDRLHVSQIGKNGVSEISVNSNKSSTKKELRNPCRASKRLAGIEPDVITSSIDCKRAPEYKSRRSKGKANAVLQQSEGGPAMELADHVSTDINAPLSGDSSSKSRTYPKIPPITDKQPEKLGDEEMNDEKSEPEQSIAFHYSWSDPCLEFAIKTLTGVLPIEDSVGNGPIEDSVGNGPIEDSVGSGPIEDSVGSGPIEDSVGNGPIEDLVGNGPNLAPDTDLFEKNKVFECAKGSSSDRNLRVNLKKSKNKEELRLPRRLSKRLAGHEPELVPALRALEYAARKSCKGKPAANVVLTNGESMQLDAGEETELTFDASDSLKSRVVEKPSKKCENSYEVQTVEESSKREKLYDTETVPKEQQQKLETEVSSETQLYLAVGKETEHTFDAYGSLETRVLEDSSNSSERTYEAQAIEDPNKSGKLYESQTVPKEQRQKLETEVNSETKLYLPYGKETEHVLHASGSLETGVLEDSSNKSEKSCEAQTVSSERQQKLEAEKIADVRSEPQLCLPLGDFWSDPCLEFAIRTLTGALPVDAAVESLPVMTPDINDQPKKELLDSMVKTANEERHNLNQSQNKKEINLVSQPLKQLLKQPELRSSSTFCENASKFANRVSYSDEADLKSNLDEGESLHEEAGNITELAHQYRNGNSLIHEEPSKKIRQFLEVKAFPAEQPEFESQLMSHENTESEFCAPFMDSWSDPCLEFAFKTLTGAITVEENLAIQGCFPEPANWHGQRDSGPALPDFGSNSFSQSDISSYYDMGEKCMPGQSSTSLDGCAGYDPKEDYSRFSKDFQGR